MKVVVFCGGRGSTPLIKELLRWPDIELTLLVNAFDDGLSTGEIRRLIPGFLGPSDFRKNILNSLLVDSYDQTVLKELMEYRTLSNFVQNPTNALEFYKANPSIASLVSKLSPVTKKSIDRLILEFFKLGPTRISSFDFSDCAFGNLLFAGAYLSNGYSFSGASDKLSELFGVAARIINISDQNAHLVAVMEDGVVLPDEATIVSPHSPGSIKDLFLLPAPLEALVGKDSANLLQTNAPSFLETQKKTPSPSTEAVKALSEADLIVYGAGTQHSSLFPSYMILNSLITEVDSRVPKVLIANLDFDHDIVGWDLQKLVESVAKYWGVQSPLDVCSHVLLDHASVFAESLGSFDNCPEIIKSSFRNQNKQAVHSGSALVDALFSIVRRTSEPEPKVHIKVALDSDTGARGNEIRQEFEDLVWKETPANLEVGVYEDPDSSVLIELKEWVASGRSSELFVGISGLGEYSLRDVRAATFSSRAFRSGFLIGSRTQSRFQWRNSANNRYVGSQLRQFLALLGGGIASIVVLLKHGQLSTDPLSRCFIINRNELTPASMQLVLDARSLEELYVFLWKTVPLSSEFAVRYKPFPKFSSQNSAIRRGVKNVFRFLRVSF